MHAPRRLYKYRSFNARTLELLVEDKVYFAEPSTFNDPMDTKPSVEPDLDVMELEQILETLTIRRISTEMTAAARSIRYKGPRTVAHIERHAGLQAQRLIAEIAYQASDSEYEQPAPVPHKMLLSMHIERELLRQHEKGVLSLATRFDCPLMWSHYGDQHRGVCIGYSIPPESSLNVQRVSYGGSRLVRASRVKAMLEDDASAAQEVDQGVLLKKARSWQYEKEWRILGAKGLHDSRLELEEIVLGSRCPWSVKHSIRKALEGRDRQVKLFEMREVPGEFKLRRYALADEDFSMPARRALTIYEGFQDVGSVAG